ncbi:MAG: hypothetical protein MZV64_36660 [Ignavibacteriales bacterium]|nr:hypothetical protein [Ignavibacteriales bacterium]
MAGWVGWENFDLSESSDDVTENLKSMDLILFSVRATEASLKQMVSSDLIFNGVKEHRTATPDPNPENISESINEKVWFIGLWARYYIPWGGNFAMFLEGSGGYAVLLSEK